MLSAVLKRTLFLAYLEANLTLWENLTFQEKVPLSPEELEKLFSKVDLTGIVDWSVQEQKEVRDLITEFRFLFALDDLDLGKTSVGKHTMKLTNPTPFNEIQANSTRSI